MQLKIILLTFVFCLLLFSLFSSFVAGQAKWPTDEDIAKALLGTIQQQHNAQTKAEKIEKEKINRALDWYTTRKGKYERLLTTIESAKEEADKCLNKSEKTQDEEKVCRKQLKVLENVKTILKGVWELVEKEGQNCTSYNPGWFCQCNLKQCDAPENQGKCVKGKCYGFYADFYCCSSPNLPTGGSASTTQPTGSAITGFAVGEEGKGTEAPPTTTTSTAPTGPDDAVKKLDAIEKDIKEKCDKVKGFYGQTNVKGEEARKAVDDCFDAIDKGVGDAKGINTATLSKSATGGQIEPQEPNFGCIKVDWKSIWKKGKFWSSIDASMWKKWPLTCAYQSLAGLYSAIQAFSYVRGAGSCFAEQPIAGASYCEACNMAYTQCTEARCKILGTACRWLPKEDASGGVCLAGICEPTAIPIIKDMKVSFFIDRTKLWKSFKGTPECPSAPPEPKALTNCLTVGEKVNYTVSDIEINITLNQKAKCRYIIDKPNSSFSDMIDFENNQFYPTSQVARIDVTGLELGQNHSIYIKCEGICGQAHAPGFDWNFVRFEFEPKPGESPPVIVKVVPDPMRQYISNESVEETIEVWLDEAGYCKYSHIGTNEACGNNLTTNWTKMCNKNEVAWNVISFNCNEDNEQCCSRGMPEPICYNRTECGRCYLKIDTTKGYEEINWSMPTPEIEEKIPKAALDYMKSLGMTGVGKVFSYMFRCADKKENLMKEEDSYMYVIMTYPPFELNLTEPVNDSTSYEREWPIVVKTSRPTECRYLVSNTSFAWPEWEAMEAIDEGFSAEHSGKTRELVPSTYFLYVRCRDIGSLEQKSFVKFKVLLDPVPPNAIRLYKWEDYLYIETDEPSDCVYSVSDCNYNFSDGSVMVGDLQYIHSAPWSLDHLYYIKCKDKWNNYPGGSPSANNCTTIVSPYEVPAL